MSISAAVIRWANRRADRYQLVYESETAVFNRRIAASLLAEAHRALIREISSVDVPSKRHWMYRQRELVQAARSWR